MSKRPNWSTPLPRPITIPDIMTLKTLGDVRELLRHVPAKRRELSTWQHVASTVDEASRGGDPQDVSTALRMVLQSESGGRGAEAGGEWMALLALCPPRIRRQFEPEYKKTIYDIDIANKLKIPKMMVPALMGDYYWRALERLTGEPMPPDLKKGYPAS
jgi:hypothetical protein